MPIEHPINSPTIHTHKRQFAWQIMIPFLVESVIIVAGAVLVVTGNDLNLGTWSDVSIIWVVAPWLLVMLLFLAVVITTIYGMTRLLRILPGISAKARSFFARIAGGTRLISDGAVKPFFSVHQAGTVFTAIVHRKKSKLKSDPIQEQEE
jgi:hypothetical protein